MAALGHPADCGGKLMGQVVGDLLPLAVGVAISPIPIIAVILMLLAPRATGTSVGFLVGWVLGIVVAVTLFTVLADVAGLSSSGQPSTAAAWIQLVLGVLLLLVAVRQWGARPGAGETPTLPGWMAAIDSFTPLKALGLGFLLAAVNPKNLAMSISAGVAIGTGGLSNGQDAVVIAVYVVLAASTVAVP